MGLASTWSVSRSAAVVSWIRGSNVGVSTKQDNTYQHIIQKIKLPIVGLIAASGGANPIDKDIDSSVEMLFIDDVSMCAPIAK